MANSYEGDFWEPVGRPSRGYRDERYRRDSKKYRRDSQDRTRAGGVILAFVSGLSGLLLLLAFLYWPGASARHQAAAAAADCEPALYLAGLPCTTVQMVVAKYNGIVNPAVQQLISESAAYTANERRNLAAAEAALSAEVSTERALDNSLAAVMSTPQNRATANSLITYAESHGNPVPSAAVLFPPNITAMAQALVRDIQALATLNAEQARSSSLTQLRSFNARVQAATAAVQSEMALIHKAVQTHPTASQEPCAPCL
jgi:hypothetical protein